MYMIHDPPICLCIATICMTFRTLLTSQPRTVSSINPTRVLSPSNYERRFKEYTAGSNDGVTHKCRGCIHTHTHAHPKCPVIVQACVRVCPVSCLFTHVR